MLNVKNGQFDRFYIQNSLGAMYSGENICGVCYPESLPTNRQAKKNARNVKELDSVLKYYICKDGQVTVKLKTESSLDFYSKTINYHLGHNIDVKGTRFSFKILHTQRWSDQFE